MKINPAIEVYCVYGEPHLKALRDCLIPSLKKASRRPVKLLTMNYDPAAEKRLPSGDYQGLEALDLPNPAAAVPEDTLVFVGCRYFHEAADKSGLQAAGAAKAGRYFPAGRFLQSLSGFYGHNQTPFCGLLYPRAALTAILLLLQTGVALRQTVRNFCQMGGTLA